MILNSRDIQKGKEFLYSLIEEFAIHNDYSISELRMEGGRAIVGESFLVLSHPDKDIKISFILSGANSREYVYECVYSDL